MDLESSTSLDANVPNYYQLHEQNNPSMIDNLKAEKYFLFVTETKVEDGCIFDKTSQLYKDSRYVSLNSKSTNGMKTDLFSVEKENQVE